MANLAGQTRPADAVVIVDQSAEALPLPDTALRVDYHHAPELKGFKNRVRNRIVEVADADVILFLDDDVRLERDFIGCILDVYERYADAAGVGGFLVEPGRTRVKRALYRAFFWGPYRDPRRMVDATSPSTQRISVLWGGVASFRREILLRYPFNESFVGYGQGDDVEISLRVSREHRLYLEPRARAVHLGAERNWAGPTDARRHFRDTVAWHHYMRKRLVPAGGRNDLAFLVSSIGNGLLALQACMRERSILPLLGIVDGYRKVGHMRGDPDALLDGR